VKQQNRIRIAFIAGRLISGKRVASLYDVDSLTTVEIDKQPDADCLREFDQQYKDYAGSNGDNFCCRYGLGKKHAISLSIKGSTFIGYITGSTAVFMGNVKGDSIYIYDREDSVHLHYRISGCVVEREEGRDTCKRCWIMK